MDASPLRINGTSTHIAERSRGPAMRLSLIQPLTRRRKNLAKEQGVELQAFTDNEKAELETWRQRGHRWHPNQLRHTAATMIRRQYGAEAAQAILGHSELSTTEIYAEKNLEAARLPS